MIAFENAPPFAAPLRFFLTAPLFAVLAGLLVLFEGPDLFASRWMPATLAATHLITIGFMLQVMLGALIQIMPVVAGANLGHPLRVARILHAGLTLGCLLLSAGFYFSRPSLLIGAAWILGGALAVFLVAGARALIGVASTSPTIRGIKLALFGLFGLALLGVGMAFGIAGGWPLPFAGLTDLHAAWGLGAWGGILLAAVAYVVVPMFQLTPGYPAWSGWWFPPSVLGLALLWSLAVGIDAVILGRLAQAGLALAGMAFGIQTFRLQRQRRRARADVTYRYWQIGLGATLLALLQLLIVAIWPGAAELPGWSLAFGVLLVAGGYVSFIVGMLYKIIPFLAWMHLQNQGMAKVAAPNMNKLLPDLDMQRQLKAWGLTLLLLLAAIGWPDWLARPAGLALAASSGWLWLNLYGATRRYRHFGRDIDEKLAALP
ncbi:MAG: hypothetical protein D3M94_13140 [Rhodocyclales bacterium GT-UBC]|nr:MAG: hypothetical protein D3M94_13140 [Rhodocyclales bacterium GT-UBC]